MTGMNRRIHLKTVIEAAEILGISGRRVRKLLEEGRIDGEKVGRDWLVYDTSYQRLKPYTIKKHKTKGYERG
jgi:excisionase family DNA binding protein